MSNSTQNDCKHSWIQDSPIKVCFYCGYKPVPDSTQNEEYTYFYPPTYVNTTEPPLCPICGITSFAHRHKAGSKPKDFERLPEASKTKDRALQEDWEKRYADMLKEFKRQTKIDMVADVLVMKSFISKEISYANQDGFDEGYGKGGMEGLKEGRADARKEVITEVKEGLTKLALEYPELQTIMKSILYDGQATLREEEKHG